MYARNAHFSSCIKEHNIIKKYSNEKKNKLINQAVQKIISYSQYILATDINLSTNFYAIKHFCMALSMSLSQLTMTKRESKTRFKGPGWGKLISFPYK